MRRPAPNYDDIEDALAGALAKLERGPEQRISYRVGDYAQHHGFVEGVPPCTDGPICAAHGWKLSPLVVAAESNGPAHSAEAQG